MMEELLRQGRYDEAKQQSLLTPAGDQAGLAALLELRAWLRDKRYEMARAGLEKDAKFLTPYLNLGAAREAIKAFEAEDPAALEPFLDDPHLGAEANCVLGVIRVREGDREGARLAFDRSLRLDPGHYRAITNLGNLELEAGRTAEAVVMYEKALQSNPDYPHAHHNLAAAYRKLGQIGKSVHHLKREQRLLYRSPARRLGDAGLPRPGRTLPGNLDSRWLVLVVVVAVVYLLLRN
ncbi:Lipopolysaccharide assembly protein B [Calidithermus terrae]|uniref:Lipopolysaccharide assembly protein B n=2 Tax=Calidithermus terrae TaxID=1408545 RepID=A0A399F7C9_9DEIN|nr:Lipopolysaccharide assembly protein B [Calidithermus terrae]